MTEVRRRFSTFDQSEALKNFTEIQCFETPTAEPNQNTGLGSFPDKYWLKKDVIYTAGREAKTKSSKQIN